jgi:PAS domain S-box-containing protein
VERGPLVIDAAERWRPKREAIGSAVIQMKHITPRVEWTGLVLALLVLGSLIGYVRYLEHNKVEAAESARLQGQAKTVAENLRQQLLAVSNALADVRNDSPRAGDARAVTAASRNLKFLTDIMPGVHGILVLDARGKVLAANRDEFLNQDASAREFFTAPRARPDLATLYVSPPFTTRRGVYSINLGRAILRPTGEFAGVVTATLDPEYFDVIMRSVIYAPNMHTFLAHGDGWQFLSQPEFPGTQGVNLNHPDALFTRHMQSGQIATVLSGTLRMTGAKRMQAMYTLQPAELHMDKPLVIAVGRELSDIYRPWLRQTELYGVVFFLLAAGSCAVLFALQRRRTALAAWAAAQERERQRLELQRTTQLSDRLQVSEAGLHESEQRLTLAADAANLGIWIRDLGQDQVWASDHWRALFGFAPAQRLDVASVLQRIHPVDRAAVSQTFIRAQQDAGGYEIEFRIVLPDGQQRWIASRGRAQFDDAGKPTLVRGVSLDITARKEAELELQQQRREVTHLSRVTMLGELSGALAHELNQPLTAILSNAQAARRFLAQDSVDLAELRDIVQDIIDEDKRAGEVIRRLRLLLRTGETQRQSVDVNEVVAEVFKLLRSDLATQGVRLQAELAPDLPQVNADRVQLQQVVINLVMNACDAMGALAAAERQLIVRTELAAGAGVLVSVIDQGCGIPVAQVEKVFESFFTTKTHGMGLGLSVCRTIVGAHGGRLWAENNPDRGASFRFTVPLDTSKAA